MPFECLNLKISTFDFGFDSPLKQIVDLPAYEDVVSTKSCAMNAMTNKRNNNIAATIKKLMISFHLYLALVFLQMKEIC